MSDQSVLDQRSRPELIEEARGHGVERPERMTRAELKDEILRRTKTGAEQTEARGLFGVARAMLASVVETGLNLPDAASLIRGTTTFDARVSGPAPVATVTLAEIYATQGHKKRALGMLDEVLREEPDHEIALRLRRELSDEAAPPQDLTLVETNGIEVQTGQPPAVAEAELDSFEQAPLESAGEVSESWVIRPLAAENVVEPRLVLLHTSYGVDLYWELTVAALERCGIDATQGRAVVRGVAFRADGRTPRREERTVPLAVDLETTQSGKLRFDEWGAQGALRAALGWEVDGDFLPLVVGRPLEELSERAVGSGLWARLGGAFA